VIVKAKSSNPIPANSIEANKQLPGQTKRELIALLHDIYSDNLKTEVEQDTLNKALKESVAQTTELNELEQQVREQCEKSRPYFEQAMFFVKKNKLPEALDSFERALKVDADNAWIRVNIGSAYLRNAQPEKAVLAFKQALELNPKNWLAYYNLGSIYATQGQKDEAISALTQAVQLVIEDRNQHMTRANLIQQLRVDAAFKPIQQDTRFQQLLNQN
jgi:tetratricopeptide (TPR) repeat protein